MDLKPADKNISLNSFTHSLRASQAVLQYGVGSMVDFPEQTLMTAAPEYWADHVVRIHDERLEKALNVSWFGMPGDKDNPKLRDGLAFVRFPEWYFCHKCRRFQPITKWVKEYKHNASTGAKDNDPEMLKRLKCMKCNQELVVARIVTVCEHGHIDDFPWIKWVHAQNMSGAKPICEHPILTFKTTTSSAEGLEGLTITCESCHAKATLQGAFSDGAFEGVDKKTQYRYDFRCMGKHPWKHVSEACDCYPKAVQRGSSSVYFPVTSTSLVIPPYSSKLTKLIEQNDGFMKCKDAITTTLDTLKSLPLSPEQIADIRRQKTEEIIKKHAKQIALSISVSEDQVQEVLVRKWLEGEGEIYSTSSVKYKAEEYEALSGEVKLSSETEDDFVREETDINDYHIPYIKQISLIHKVREVQALTGFSRLKPVEQPENQDEIVHNFISIKEPETDWYPAYQVRGEGIFVEFEDSAIREWIVKHPIVNERADLLNENYRNSFIGKNRPRKITPKFLLLHTISHLLIKQLSFECGYSIASLKERLYCSDAEDGKNMAGIFIYTASGDSEGTLGGLVRQGRDDTFPEIFKKAIESAVYCSNDPVCSLSQGQGRDSLNLASCYSCTLVPETSCEEFNVFLDRGVVVGTFDDKEMGFFYKQLYFEEGWNKCELNNSKSTNAVRKESLSFWIADRGTDLSDQNYEEIWRDILEWSEDDEEKENIDSIIGFFKDNSIDQKPCKGAELTISNSNRSIVCDLYWPDLKIAYFTSDNFEDYDIACDLRDLLSFKGNSMNLIEFLECFKEGE